MKQFACVLVVLTLCTSCILADQEKAKEKLCFAIPEQQETDNKLLDFFIQQFGADDAVNNILLLPWKQIDGSDGILPVLVLQKPDPVVNKMLQNQQQILGNLKKRREAIEEIDTYHQELNHAKDELHLLKQERDAITKRLEYLKALMDNQGKTRLERLEKGSIKK